MQNLKQSRSKEQALGKLVQQIFYLSQMKIYLGQSLLNMGVTSVQEQGMNLLVEFLIKCLRKVGQQAKRIYELQGRQEGNIFHVMIALDHLKFRPDDLLVYLNKLTDPLEQEIQLNYSINTIMQSIFKDQLNIKYQPVQLSLKNLFYESFDPVPGKRLDDQLAIPLYFRDEILARDRKELTEKEIKELKKKQTVLQEEDVGAKIFSLKRNNQPPLNENLFNQPLKKVKTIEEFKQEEDDKDKE